MTARKAARLTAVLHPMLALLMCQILSALRSSCWPLLLSSDHHTDVGNGPRTANGNLSRCRTRRLVLESSTVCSAIYRCRRVLALKISIRSSVSIVRSKDRRRPRPLIRRQTTMIW
uniref:Putative secreted peptide n=1 Tax=Anopheles braziliensis TaxID=58242 RepID=A0A2M3ZX76_9DIPT